jgi:ABC-type multidrug transport system ATPase subunit
MEDMGIGALGLPTAGRLSRGQIWKTALACVAAVEPELWLVDEPFASGMDAVGMAAFRRQARARAEAGGTVIYTTQMVELAADFADRVCVLREGRVVLWDTSAVVRTLLASPAGAEGVLKGTLSQP